MASEYIRNREVALELVYELGTFTVQEFIDRFVGAMGNVAIDSHEAIPDFLKGLVGVGVLRYQGGVYVVA